MLAAIEAGVDALEFDVRITKDQQLVINHDKSLKRTYGHDLIISEHTLATLRKAAPQLLTLSELINVSGTTPLVIELKEITPAKLLLPELHKLKKSQYSLVSFKLAALKAVRDEFPGVHMSLLSFAWPCLREHQAHKARLQGIGVYSLFLNPLVYCQAKRHGLEVYTYTVNQVWKARLIKKLYPRVNACSDRPDLLQSLRSK